MMLAAFSNMETIHIAAYALLLETIGMPDSEFSAFMEYEEMAAKHDYLGQFGVENERDILTSMAVFGGLMLWYGAKLTIFKWGSLIPLLQLPEGLRSLPLTIGGGLILLFSIGHLVRLALGVDDRSDLLE